jgi:hypothetical protein
VVVITEWADHFVFELAGPHAVVTIHETDNQVDGQARAASQSAHRPTRSASAAISRRRAASACRAGSITVSSSGRST